MKQKMFISLIIITLMLLFGVVVSNNNINVGFAANDSEIFLPVIYSDAVPIPTPPPDAFDWPMAGANVERTSWISEEVRGQLKAEWYTHFDAYISQKVQIIAAIGFLYISASDGLHGLNAETGGEVWFYPTELPLGHSPTYSEDVVYAGGMDKKIHAVDALTGEGIWTFEAGAGFHTNPLVVGDKVFAGNRDGYFYAIYKDGSRQGQLAWKYKTGGPILYSAAYKEGIVYFASNDMHAYAIDAQTGSLVWTSAKLPGNGFHSFWPVVYGDYVIFSGTWNYRTVKPGPIGNHNYLERLDVYPPDAEQGDPVGPYGTEPGNWAPGTTTIDAYRITNYFEEKPHRRLYFVLHYLTGQEYTFDSDHDGQPEYAPILYYGAKGGTRYPPAVGPDGVIYQTNNYIYGTSIARGQVSGWKIGTSFISVPSPTTNAVDEPLGFSIGGNIVYTRLCCEREAKAFDLVTGENWQYYGQGANPLRRTLPDLYELGWDFAYWKHGDPSSPIPYNGRVYTINNNAVVAFSADGLDPVLPPDEDLGDYRGENPGQVEKSTVVTGLNTKVSVDNTSWPLLIQQERYYEQDYRPDARTTYSRLFEVTGSQSGVPVSLSVENYGITTRLDSGYAGGQTLRTWISRRTPTILFENTSNTYQLRGTLIGLAYPSSSGIQVVSNPATIQGNALSESWLLVWDGTDERRWMPLVVSLQNQPTQIVTNANGLTISFPSSSGYLGITPLYGMSAPLSTEVNTWFSGIPQPTVDRVRLLNRLARYYPQSCTENRSIDGASSDVSITYNYQYIQFQDAWQTQALQLAYLPPSLALASWNGSPIRINEQPLENHLDLVYLTPLGRVAGVANTNSVTVRLPGLARYWKTFQEDPVSVNPNDPLRAVLIDEIQQMVAAGHLRPGYGVHGLWDGIASGRIGHFMADYYHNPAETIYTLMLALPFLPSDLQSQVEQYMQSEFQAYPPYAVSHVGWANGSSRSFFDLPPEVEADTGSFTACDCSSWGTPGENIYASWLYANHFGDAVNIFNQTEDKLEDLPDFIQSYPHRLNSTLIGYLGYLRLAQLANVTPSGSIENYMIDLLIARAALSKYPSALAETGFEYSGYKWSVRILAFHQPDTLFTPRIIGTLWNQMPIYGYPKDNLTGLSGGGTGGGISFGIDFVNLVPELADFLKVYAQSDVQDAVDDYNERAPFWFVAQAEELGGENVMVPVYDVVGLFQAKAMILDESRNELEKYLDVPITPVGDLYYLLNLIATLKASP